MNSSSYILLRPLLGLEALGAYRLDRVCCMGELAHHHGGGERVTFDG
jgi:hypothetical protein